MKRILLILGFMISVAAYSQVSDATMRTYTDTYINTNGAGSITGAMLNTDLNYLIDSKVNKDSATTVRIAPTKDSLFITYYGFSEDTIVLGGSDTTIWGSNGSDKIYTLPATNYVGIGTNNPMTRLHLVDSTGSLGINPYVYSTTATNSGQLNFGRFNGTPSSYSAITTGTYLGQIGFAGSESSSATVFAASIRVNSTQAWTTSANGNKMEFYTTENDSSVFAASMTIDEHANVEVPLGDVIVMGGWSDFTPTWAWTGSDIGTPTTVVARYERINNKVSFYVDAEGTNSGGTIATAFNITLPITPTDVNAYIPCNGIYNGSVKSTPTTRFTILIDATTNLKAYGAGISIANAADFKICIFGEYEITGD